MAEGGGGGGRFLVRFNSLLFHNIALNHAFAASLFLGCCNEIVIYVRNCIFTLLLLHFQFEGSFVMKS